MAQFRKAVITEKGLALIQKTQMQQIKLEFSRIRTGAGIYAETELLNNLTALKDVRQEFGISSISVHDEKTIKLSTAISNKDLQESYFIGEIGVFATDPDEGEILYSILVALPEKADYLPVYNGFAPVGIYIDIYQAVSDSTNATIRADTGAYALAKDLESLKEKIKELEEQLGEGGSKILIGPPTMQLQPGETLFIVEGMPEPIDFKAASFSNLTFSPDQPQNTEYWADISGGAGSRRASTPVLNGKLAVSTEEEAPEDTVFLANLNP